MTCTCSRLRNVSTDARDTDATASPPFALTVAIWLAVAQVTVEIVVVAVSDRFPFGGRVFLGGCLALGYAFARSAHRLRAGGAFGVLMVEATSILVALGATSWPGAARVSLALVAVTVIALVLSSLHAFPSPTLPTT